MSTIINRVELEGRVVSDLELRKTSNKGYSVINLRLAHNNPRSRTPVYIDVEVWGKTAEQLAETASRGSYVVVHGELRRDKWEQDGSPRSKIKITASRVIVDNSKAKSADNGAPNISF